MSPHRFVGSGVKLSKNRRMYCPLLQKPQFLIFFSFIWLALTSLDQPLVMLNDGKEDAERAAGANDVVSLLSPEIVETSERSDESHTVRATIYLDTLARFFRNQANI